MSIKGFHILPNEEKTSSVILKVGAGEKWTDLIEYTMKHGYSGLEYLAGIPGTVGGAPVQNIGAYGAELSDVFIECQVFDIQEKRFILFDKNTCRFAYRNSIFKENNLHARYIIVYVTLELLKILSTDMKLLSENIVKDILHRRSIKLPDPWLDVGNAGSFFANPIITLEQYEALKQQEVDIPFYPLENNRRKLPAGWLVEQCQWKGKCLGSAGTWHLHANVLVNNRSKDGSDIWQLAQEIRKSVEKRFRIRLEPEVHIIRKFMSIKHMMPSKLIIQKSDWWKNDNLKRITIPPDKNVCVHVLFATIGLRRTVHFADGFSGNLNQDTTRILQWIDELNIAKLYFHHFHSLTIVPNDHRLTDLTSAAFSRASIDIAGNTLLTFGYVRCMELGGCQFTQRPIDLHFNLLRALGGVSDDGQSFRLTKDWESSNEDFQFDCRTKNGISSVGVTIHSILSCCALPMHVRCKLTHVALEASVQTVIALATQYRPMIVIESDRQIIFERDQSCVNDHLVLEHLPIDQIYLFTICSFAAMLRFKLLITNFEYDQCITEYLKSIMSVFVNDAEGTALFDGITSFSNNQYDRHRLICDVYPQGLPTDISPILTALFIAQDISFELIDHIYDVRNTQCKEFSKLGYETITNGNQITYNGIKQENRRCDELFAHDIRGGVAVLLLALHHVNADQWKKKDKIVLHQYEQVERGYGSLLHQELRHFGFDVQLIRELQLTTK